MTRQHPDWPLEEAQLAQRYLWSEAILGTNRPFVPAYRRPHLLSEEHMRVRDAHLASIWDIMARATATHAWDPEWDQVMTAAFNGLYHRTWLYPEAPGEIDPGVYSRSAVQEAMAGGTGWHRYAMNLLLCSDQAIRMLQHQVGALRYRLTEGELPWRGQDPNTGRGSHGPTWGRLKLRQFPPPGTAPSSPEARAGVPHGERRPRESLEPDFTLDQPALKQARTVGMPLASGTLPPREVVAADAPAVPVIRLEQQPKPTVSRTQRGVAAATPAVPVIQLGQRPAPEPEIVRPKPRSPEVVRPVPKVHVVTPKPRPAVVHVAPQPVGEGTEVLNPRCWYCGERRVDNPNHDFDHSRCRFKGYTLAQWSQSAPVPWAPTDSKEFRDRVTNYFEKRFTRKQERNRVARVRHKFRKALRETQVPATGEAPQGPAPSTAKPVAQGQAPGSPAPEVKQVLEEGEVEPAGSDHEEPQDEAGPAGPDQEGPESKVEPAGSDHEEPQDEAGPAGPDQEGPESKVEPEGSDRNEPSQAGEDKPSSVCPRFRDSPPAEEDESEESDTEMPSAVTITVPVSIDGASSSASQATVADSAVSTEASRMVRDSAHMAATSGSAMMVVEELTMTIPVTVSSPSFTTTGSSGARNTPLTGGSITDTELGFNDGQLHDLHVEVKHELTQERDDSGTAMCTGSEEDEANEGASVPEPEVDGDKGGESKTIAACRSTGGDICHTPTRVFVHPAAIAAARLGSRGVTPGERQGAEVKSLPVLLEEQAQDLRQVRAMLLAHDRADKAAGQATVAASVSSISIRAL